MSRIYYVFIALFKFLDLDFRKLVSHFYRNCFLLKNGANVEVGKKRKWDKVDNAEKESKFVSGN